MPAPAEQSAFAAGLRSGTLPPGVTAPDPAEAARRFAVYRNNVTQSLTEALNRRFPVVARLVGAEFFRATARLFADQHPPQSPVLHEWGADFAAFLAGFAPAASLPALPDVARLEYARGRAFHAADAPPLAPEALLAASQAPQRAQLALHPSVQIIASPHPIVRLWQANQPGQIPAPLHDPRPETALILRDSGYELPVRAISPGDCAFLGAVAQGKALLAAASDAQHAEPGHDPLPLLLSLMQAGALIAP